MIFYKNEADNIVYERISHTCDVRRYIEDDNNEFKQPLESEEGLSDLFLTITQVKQTDNVVLLKKCIRDFKNICNAYKFPFSRSFILYPITSILFEIAFDKFCLYSTDLRKICLEIIKELCDDFNDGFIMHFCENEILILLQGIFEIDDFDIIVLYLEILIYITYSNLEYAENVLRSYPISFFAEMITNSPKEYKRIKINTFYLLYCLSRVMLTPEQSDLFLPVIDYFSQINKPDYNFFLLYTIGNLIVNEQIANEISQNMNIINVINDSLEPNSNHIKCIQPAIRVVTMLLQNNLVTTIDGFMYIHLLQLLDFDVSDEDEISLIDKQLASKVPSITASLLSKSIKYVEYMFDFFVDPNINGFAYVKSSYNFGDFDVKKYLISMIYYVIRKSNYDIITNLINDGAVYILADSIKLDNPKCHRQIIKSLNLCFDFLLTDFDLLSTAKQQLNDAGFYDNLIEIDIAEDPKLCELLNYFNKFVENDFDDIGEIQY